MPVQLLSFLDPLDSRNCRRNGQLTDVTMISLCRQTSPLDMDAAVELIQLICWIEHPRRENTEFFLVYRKDCPLWLGKEFEKLTSNHFGRCAARPARNHDVGWP